MPTSLSRINELPSQRTGEWRRLDRSRAPQLQRHLFYDLSTTSLDRHSSTLALIVCPKLVLEDGPRIYHAQVCNIAKRLLAEPEKLDVTQSWLKKDLTVMLNQDKKKGGGTKATEDFCREFAKNPKFDAKITRVDLVARDLRLSLFGIFLSWGDRRLNKGKAVPTREAAYQRAGTAVPTRGGPPSQRGGDRRRNGETAVPAGGTAVSTGVTAVPTGGTAVSLGGTAVPTERNRRPNGGMGLLSQRAGSRRPNGRGWYLNGINWFVVVLNSIARIQPFAMATHSLIKHGWLVVGSVYLFLNGHPSLNNRC